MIMSFRDNKALIITFLSGILAGVFFGGSFLNLRSLFRNRRSHKKHMINDFVTQDQESDQTPDPRQHAHGKMKNTDKNDTDPGYTNTSQWSRYMHHNRGKREQYKINEIDKAPLELRKRFDNKGYVFISQNLATVNTELNEFVELMRKYDLYVLNGCRDPDTCVCNFRHKHCRLFMIRKYSNSHDLQFFAPSCSGVTVISPSNKDIANETPIHEFVQMFLNKFSDRVMDLVSYVSYIIDPHRSAEYVVDITMIADPYDRLYGCTSTDGGYGQPMNSKTITDDLTISRIIEHKSVPKRSHDDTTMSSDNAFDKNHKCSLTWHQDHFLEAKTNQTHAYDFVAMFVLSTRDVTPHKLMIGKLKSEIDTKDMTLDEIQQHIVPVSDSMIDENNSSDIGYVIDQRQKYFHKHSDFEHNGINSRRNVITIRIKHLK